MHVVEVAAGGPDRQLVLPVLQALEVLQALGELGGEAPGALGGGVTVVRSGVERGGRAAAGAGDPQPCSTQAGDDDGRDRVGGPDGVAGQPDRVQRADRAEGWDAHQPFPSWIAAWYESRARSITARFDW
ncbi:hypothetical protein GCM10020369_83340 [Cryptosporangium minutisporangium]|uniref:Uncharacterized protein n=1 Tax=Cryptosporangium minutisporangium TaxID=113569 RepID=A0ABP6TDW8_9ACTN